MRFNLKLSIWVVLMALALAVSGCGLDMAEKGRKPSPDWSRGKPVSKDVSGSVGMAVAGAGERVHFIWPTAAGEETRIHYLQLNEAATIVADHDLDLPSGRLRTPRLILAGDSHVHLFWVRRSAEGGQWTLWHALLDSSGHLWGDSTPITPEEMNVSGYVVSQTASGQGYVMWESGDLLFAAQVNREGTLSQPVYIASGESPTLIVDDTGALHAAWRQETEIVYTSFPEGVLAETAGTRVAGFVRGTGDSVAGPVLGEADGRIYVFWSLFSLSGDEGGVGRTEFVSFPADSPGPSVPERIGIMPLEDQPYQPYQGPYPLTKIAPPPASPSFSSDYIFGVSTAAGAENQLAVAVAANQLIQLNMFTQMAVLLFEDGQYIGYQMAAKTRSFSQKGILLADFADNLHLAWREGAGGRKLYYATTVPTTRAAIDQLDASDLLSMLLAGSLEGLTGILFFPLAFGWLLPGILLLGVRQLRKDDDRVTDLSSLFFLLLAIILYQGAKLLFLPTILSYVPFSAWIDLPPHWVLPLRIGVPFLIFGLGVFGAEWVRQRRPSLSTLSYFFALSGTDAIFTLAIYGVNFLGVF